MQTYGGKTLPIVSSEWGYSTGTVGTAYTPVATAQLQGDYLARMMLVNLSQGIPLSIWYDWKNDAAAVTTRPLRREFWNDDVGGRAEAGL